MARRKTRWRRAADYFGVATFLAIVAVVAAVLFDQQAGEYAAPFRVMDGDSLEKGETRMRLDGIDAPEFRQTCIRQSGGQAVSWDCGREARATLARLAGDGAVCRGLEIDRYGRVIVRCRRGELDINREMVRLGMAVSSGFNGYHAEERAARDAAVGIWAGWFDQPREWRERHGMLEEEGEPASRPASVISSLLDRVRNFLSGWFD